MNLFIPSAIARWREIKALFEKGLAVSSPDFIVKNYPETGQVSLTLRVAPIAAPATAPPATESCFELDEFWPTYDPGIPDRPLFYRHWCCRFIEFDFDQTGETVSGQVTYKFNKPGNLDYDADLGDVVPDFWFTPTGPAVTEILAIYFPSGLPTGSLHVKIWMEMHRLFQDNHGAARTTIGDETTSIPKVLKICYTAL